MDITTHWGWPQWTMAAMLFIGFAITAAHHGKPRLQTTGEDKGKPQVDNAFVALARVALWAFVLICGGFFR